MTQHHSTERPRETPEAQRSEHSMTWGRRILLIAGVVLLGISLRSAVTGMSPLLPLLREDLGMGDAGATLLGMLPTLAFGVAGFAAAALIRRITPEATAVLAMVLAAIGLAVRAMVDDQVSFLVLSVVALFGMGMGNVVGAPLVKKHFASNPAPMLTLFALLMQAGATIPAMAAVPLAEGSGSWRFSVGSWALLSAAAAIPWILQLRRALGERAAQKAGAGAAAASGPSDSYGIASLITNPVAVGTALFYAMASLITYAMLAWLPTILQSFGHTLERASTGYSIFTFMTLPLAAVMPWLAQRMNRTAGLMLVVTIGPAIGFAGLLIVPELYWVWTIIIGLIGGAFPLAIAHFNLRTRTTDGSGALSGFAMGVGYLFGTLGPLLGGWLSAATGSWNLPVIVYAALAALMLIGGLMMTKTGRYLEGPERDGAQTLR